MRTHARKSFWDDLGRFGDRTALVDEEGRQLSYAELENLCARAAVRLYTERKKLLWVPCRNDIESVVGYLAALRSGHAVMLVDGALSPDLREQLLVHYSPDYVWTTSKDDRHLNTLFNHYGFLNTRAEPPRMPIHSTLALLLSTSGTTGSPKMVRLTARNLDANSAAIVHYMRITQADRPITNLPIHYSYGLSILNSHLRVGATVLVTAESLTSRRFWEHFRTRGGTSLAGVPYTYEMLRELRFSRIELPTLRCMTQAGGRLTPALAEEFAALSCERGFDFYLMYGQTEATARMAYLPPSKSMRKPGSVGRAIPGGEIILRAADGDTVSGAGREGEVVYRGQNVMMGYATVRDELSEGDELQGVLHTGDTGRFDEEGDLFITGRLRRFIKLLGRRVNLDDLEMRLSNSGLEVACGGKDDLLLVATTASEGQTAIQRQLMSSFKISPRLVRFVAVDRLSRTASGKINYEELFSGRLKEASGGN